jgi:hypothetical protein
LETEHSPEYRTIAVFGSVADAELVRGLLEADGIVAAVHEGTDAVLLPGAGREVRVLVPSDDLARARELLATPSPGIDLDDADEPRVSPPPPRGWSMAWFALLAAAVLGALALLL